MLVVALTLLGSAALAFLCGLLFYSRILYSLKVGLVAYPPEDGELLNISFSCSHDTWCLNNLASTMSLIFAIVVDIEVVTLVTNQSLMSPWQYCLVGFGGFIVQRILVGVSLFFGAHLRWTALIEEKDVPRLMAKTHVRWLFSDHPGADTIDECASIYSQISHQGCLEDRRYDEINAELKDLKIAYEQDVATIEARLREQTATHDPKASDTRSRLAILKAAHDKTVYQLLTEQQELKTAQLQHARDLAALLDCISLFCSDFAAVVDASEIGENLRLKDTELDAVRNMVTDDIGASDDDTK